MADSYTCYDWGDSFYFFGGNYVVLFPFFDRGSCGLCALFAFWCIDLADGSYCCSIFGKKGGTF